LRKKPCFCLLILAFLLPFSPLYPDSPLLLDRPYSTGYWQAGWITHPGLILSEHAAVLFRKNVHLQNPPGEFVIHISADNRYRLFVNGDFICRGPARSDLTHWYYETLDIARFLRGGSNVLAVEVVNSGPKRGFSHFSNKTGLVVQGHSSAESIINTRGTPWKCHHNKGWHGRTVDWIGRRDIVSGLYIAGPTDSVVAADCPWGWEVPDYDDSAWPDAVWLELAGSRDSQFANGINYSGGQFLVPRPIALLEQIECDFARVARSEGVELDRGFTAGRSAVLIPAHRKAEVLIDNEVMTIGYPELNVSGGAGSKIRLTCAEGLYGPEGKKGNRNEIDGKRAIGISDIYMPDGGEHRRFLPAWFRCFRFIEIEIETRDQPLVIHRFRNLYSNYPIECRAGFYCDDYRLNALWEPGWRTAKICAQDILMSDAYYEQMQYIGDALVHAKTVLLLSGDDSLVRNALVQFDRSRFPDGLTLACYPNDFHLVIPLYSLVWIDMIHDYMMLRGDPKFIASFRMGMENVLAWFSERLRPDGLLGELEWWNYADWSPGFENGVPPGIENGGSALFSLHFAYTLGHAADIFSYIGEREKSQRFRGMADEIKGAVRALCYDEEKQLFAETPARRRYTQHSNIMAILTGTVRDQAAVRLLDRILEDRSLAQCALFFRYYLFQALKKVERGDLFAGLLGDWSEMLDQGLSTFTEVPLHYEWQRSDCHPWSTSPNIAMLDLVCGINPIEPGFRSVEIRPQLGALKEIEVEYPHYMGIIRLHLRRSEDDGLSGKITLPGDLSGGLIWRGRALSLSGGEQEIDF